jgi:membrane protein DedA with SNARE-associated domain
MIAAVAPAGLGGYVILYLAVAAAWIGIPIVGAGALAAAGVLASESELNLWLVIVVATFAAWTGGYGGDWFGGRAGSAVTDHDGRWQRQRRQVMAAGERVYRRRGRLAVFVTPTWVSGALRNAAPRVPGMERARRARFDVHRTLGAYGIGAAVIGQLSAKRGTRALAVAAFALVAVAIAIRRKRSDADGTRKPAHAAPNQNATDRPSNAPDHAHGHP